MINYVGHCFGYPGVQLTLQGLRYLTVILLKDVFVLLTEHLLPMGKTPMNDVFIHWLNNIRHT